MQARLGFLQKKTQQQEASAITHSYRTATTVVDGDAVVSPAMYVPASFSLGCFRRWPKHMQLCSPPVHHTSTWDALSTEHSITGNDREQHASKRNHDSIRSKCDFLSGPFAVHRVWGGCWRPFLSWIRVTGGGSCPRCVFIFLQFMVVLARQGRIEGPSASVEFITSVTPLQINILRDK